jgi:hypothetical protein
MSLSWYIVAGLTFLALFLGGALKYQIGKTAVAETRVKTLEADAKRTAKVTTKRAKAEQVAKPKAEKKAQDLGAAISKAPAWADQPVPQEVQDALAQ